MRISEIFRSIQGEGHFIGFPTIFIRLSGCNLKCRMNTTKFVCDTEYHIKGKDMSILEILSEVEKLTESGKVKNICITGGNPSIQKEVNGLIKTLIIHKYKVYIEDNGSIKFPEQYENCIVICSPKYYFNLKKWMFNTKNKPNYFKFVYTSKLHEHILKFIEKHHIPRKKISIMVEGVARDEVIENSRNTILFCYQHNFRFSPREHIMIWNRERGV